MNVIKEEIVKTEELEARYQRYKGILKDLTIMSDKLCDLYCKNAEDMHSKILAEMD